MASITKTDTANGKRYIVNYRAPDGRQRRKTFPRKIDADNFAATVETDKLRGTYRDPDAARVTFKAYAERWLAAQTCDETSRESAERALRLHVYPTLGGKQLGRIQPSTVQAWLRGLEVKSSTYARSIFGTVSSILSAAVDDDLFGKNPCRARSVRTPKADPRRVVPWTAERVLAVRDALPERYRIVATIAAGIGLRQGEVFGLSPADIDFLRGTVTVRRQVRLFKGRLSFRLAKGGKERTVPLPSPVREALAAHLAAYPAQPVSLGWDSPEGKPIVVDLVVTTPQGSALRRNTFNPQVWTPALKAAHVERSRDNGCHALRHFFASVLLDAGESIKAVSDYLGHADPGFTLRTYTHLMPTSDERTRQAVDAALSGYNVVTSAAIREV